MSLSCAFGMNPQTVSSQPYAKYWQPNMGELPEGAKDAVAKGAQATHMGFEFQELNQLLEAGYLPLENGYTYLDSGQLFVAAHTPMPGVSGKMIDWWFGWHGEESERYRLWHPQAHLRVNPKVSYESNSDLSCKERYVGNVSYVDEYIGPKIHRLAIQFYSPEEFGFRTSEFEQAGIETIICARVGIPNLPINFAYLVHAIRRTEQGCEMRSRFWLGKLEFREALSGLPLSWVTKIPVLSKFALSPRLGQEMLVHCAMEMRHLAGFLPDLYRDYN